MVIHGLDISLNQIRIVNWTENEVQHNKRYQYIFIVLKITVSLVRKYFLVEDISLNGFFASVAPLSHRWL